MLRSDTAVWGGGAKPHTLDSWAEMEAEHSLNHDSKEGGNKNLWERNDGTGETHLSSGDYFQELRTTSSEVPTDMFCHAGVRVCACAHLTTWKKGKTLFFL